MNPQIVLNFYLGAEGAKSAEQLAAAVISSLPSPSDYSAGQPASLPTPMDYAGELSTESGALPTPMDAMVTGSAGSGEGLPTPFDIPGSESGLPEPTRPSYPITAPPPTHGEKESPGPKR